MASFLRTDRPSGSTIQQRSSCQVALLVIVTWLGSQSELAFIPQASDLVTAISLDRRTMSGLAADKLSHRSQELASRDALAV